MFLDGCRVTWRAAIQISTDSGMHESGEFAPCLCWVLAMLPPPGFPYMAPERASRRRHPLMATASMASAATRRLCRSITSVVTGRRSPPRCIPLATVNSNVSGSMVRRARRQSPQVDEVPSALACVAVERSIGRVPQVALPADRPDVRPLAQQCNAGMRRQR
jgi:hypothetical protein